jgi:prepilin-type N-terminal cleavage/methylation domain-containing protein
MKIPANRRPGFTLMELIVVIGIILLLMALTLSAVFRVRESQVEKVSTESVRKIQIGFDQQWKAARDQIITEKGTATVATQTGVVPQTIANATKSANGSNNTVRRDALHMKLRLRQEFPQSFAEADRTRFVAAYPAFGSTPDLQVYLPKLSLSNTIQPLAPDSADKEAAVLLYLILTQGRGGVTFNPENVGGVTTMTVGGAQMKVFTDAWGNPITFRRWTDANDDPINAVANELSQPPFAPLAAPGKYQDLQDPEGSLGSSQAANWATPRATVLQQLFINQLGNDPFPVFNANINPFDGLNRGPVVFSMGKDGKSFTPDDIYGFRIQQSGKGN